MARNRWSTLGLVATMTMVLSPLTKAAEPTALRPQAKWVVDGQVGIFYHWGLDAYPHFTDVSAWEQHLKSVGWSPNGMVSAAQRARAKYIIFATFHSRVGYVKVWPSKVPGSASTRRDYLGELIAAAKAAGIKVIVYITDDPKHWNEGSEWLAPEARDEIGFGKYAVAVMDELMQNYPDLGGFWWDGWNDYWTQIDVDAYVKRKRPELVTFRNHNDSVDEIDKIPTKMDILSQEDWKRAWEPEWDYPSGTYIPQPRAQEAIYRLNETWWYAGGNPPVDYEGAIKKYVTSLGASQIATMSFGPKDTGKFSDNIEAFLDYFQGWLAPRAESLLGTEGGGYASGGLQPGNWNAGAYGMTTVKRGDPNLHYVHILTAPANGTDLRLRDAGYRVASVEDLISRRSVPFSQKDGYLTVEVPQGYVYDTVLKVRTTGREHLLPRSSLSVRANHELKPAANMLDDNYWSYFDSGVLPVDITIDLGAPKDVAYLLISQREDCPVPDNVDRSYYSTRIREYEVYASNDPNVFGNPVRGTLKNQRGVQALDVKSVKNRYVHLRVLNNYSYGKANYIRVVALDAATAYVVSADAGESTP